MGMYDYINGEQVKCFYKPVYSSTDNVLWHSGGNLFNYSDGSELPLKTLYYNYPSNFMIFDCLEDDYIVHIIKDKKVYKTCSVEEMKEEYFMGNTQVVNYYGNTMYNIKSKLDMLNFIAELKELGAKVESLSKTESMLYKEFMVGSRLIVEFENCKNTIDVFGVVTETNIECIYPILKEKGIFDFDSFTNYIANNGTILLEDESFIDMFNGLMGGRLGYDFEMLYLKHNEESERVRKLEKPLFSEFNSKWYLKDTYLKEKKFGEYLHSMVRLLDGNGGKSDCCYEVCCKAFATFISDNKGIKNSYIDWLSLNKEEINELDKLLDVL